MQSLWMLVASLLFALMGVCVKLASSQYSTSEIVMYRGITGLCLLSVLAYTNRVSLVTTMPVRHIGRGLVGVLALWLWFYPMGQLPLAMAITLNYMSPIWIAAILFGVSWWGGKTSVSWGLMAAIAFSFVGVVMLLQPSMQARQFSAGLIALGSGMLAALAYLQVRAMGLMGEPETRVVFYFSLTGAVAGCLAGVIDHDWHRHTPGGIVLLVLIGLTASTAQLAMTRAYRLGNPLVTANLQYSGIIFSSILGMLVWHDKLTALSWCGIAVIAASGVMATFFHTRVQSTPASDDIVSKL